jgi:hypothetical protein
LTKFLREAPKYLLLRALDRSSLFFCDKNALLDSKKEVFSADQVLMHARHADGPERITGGLACARFPGGHGEGAAMTIPDGSFSLYPSACFACICR